MNQTPKAFMSYSHDSDDHKAWVSNFSKKLRSFSIDVILDQWDLKFGNDVAAFIESNIEDSDKVLIICTDQYVEKANSGKGGVGYEKTIVTRELLENSQSDRFVPVVRQYSGKDKMPKFLGVRYYADLSDESKFESETNKLIRQLLGHPPEEKNPLGQPVTNTIRNIGKGIFGRSNSSKINFGNIKKRLREGDLFDFNAGYSTRYCDTLNRLILDANKYHDLNIIFDSEIQYIHEHGLGSMFLEPRHKIYCGIYEFVYKCLNDNERVRDLKYPEGIFDILQQADWHQTIDYLQKFDKILEIFEDIMINSQGIISQDFPDGRYDEHALVIFRDRRRKCSNLLNSML